MSTRSNIIVQGQDGKFRRIYCHFDGYVSGVGATLYKHYNSQELADGLAALGDLSSLRERLAPGKGEKHTYDNSIKDVTVAYGRDRGETKTDAQVFRRLIEAWPGADTDAEYVYVWRIAHDGAGAWHVGIPDETMTLEPLKLAVVRDRVLSAVA